MNQTQELLEWLVGKTVSLGGYIGKLRRLGNTYRISGYVFSLEDVDYVTLYKSGTWTICLTEVY